MTQSTLHDNSIDNFKLAKEEVKNAKDNLHILAVTMIAKTINDFLPNLKIIDNEFTPRLDMYPHADHKGNPFEIYMDISFKKNSNSVLDQNFLRDNGKFINAAHSTLNSLAESILIEDLSFNKEAILSIVLSNNPEENFNKITQSLLTKEQNAKLAASILEKDLKENASISKKMKL